MMPGPGMPVPRGVHSDRSLTILRTICNPWPGTGGASAEGMAKMRPDSRDAGYSGIAIGQAGVHVTGNFCPIPAGTSGARPWPAPDRPRVPPPRRGVSGRA